jgi:hypothetical protein
MKRGHLAALSLLGVVIACAASEPVVERQPARPEPSATPPEAVLEARPEPHLPEQPGDWFRLDALIGRKIDQLHPSTCAAAAGFELASGLIVDGRALAVRRCARFRGPHAALTTESPGDALLTVLSDGGLIVFAVATREYELDPAKRVAERLLETLTLAGCQQVQSNEQSVGFVDCPKGPGWAAVSRVALPADAGAGHAVVFEVGRTRSTAESIAAAFASAARR